MPYSTCESDGSLVAQVMVAPVCETLIADTEEMVGAVVSAGGRDTGFTVISTESAAVPLTPVQAIEYEWLPSVCGITVCEPAALPEKSIAVPFLSVHDVASVELHESVVELPRVMAVGFANKDTVGSGFGISVAVVG